MSAVRAATWNLGHQHGDYVRRLKAIVETLRTHHPDVVMLQEVWADEGGEDQVAILAEALEMYSTRTPPVYWHKRSFGNAILSRWPIGSAESIDLADENGDPTPRTMLFATVKPPKEESLGTLTVVSTHFEHRFDRSATRVAQAIQLATEVAARRGKPDKDFPVIVGADFNGLPDSDEIRILTGLTAPAMPGLVFTDSWTVAGDGTPGYTWCRSNPHLADATWPNRRLDYLMVSWPRPAGKGVPLTTSLLGTAPIDGIVASDHYGVLTELRNS